MTGDSSGTDWYDCGKTCAPPTGVVVFARLFECRNCGSFRGYASHPRNFAEKYILALLFLRPVRCGDCSSRSFRSRLVPVKKHPQSTSARDAARLTADLVVLAKPLEKTKPRSA